MSTRAEQHNALLITRDLLRELLTTKDKELRAKVYRCLRHYPPLQDTGEPILSNDGFSIP